MDRPPPAFRERIKAYTHTAWVQTALLPEPEGEVAQQPGGEIFRWQVPAGEDYFFAGDCFGDGSFLPAETGCGGAVGRAVVEVYSAGVRRHAVGRSASGTLPGRLQSAEGAERHALMFWLRHLDPGSELQPVFLPL